MFGALEDVTADLDQVNGVALGGVADINAARVKNDDCACAQRGQTGMNAVQNMRGCNSNRAFKTETVEARKWNSGTPGCWLKMKPSSSCGKGDGGRGGELLRTITIDFRAVLKFFPQTSAPPYWERTSKRPKNR